jgi:hypothetical protein
MRGLAGMGAMAVILALTGGAAEAADTPPAPPKSFDQAGVQAWIEANLAREGWPLIEVDRVGVTFGGPDGIKGLPDGTLQAQIRREYFGPDNLGPVNTRSSLQTWNVDCKGPRMRITAMQIFQLNNLGGLSDARDDASAPWAPPRPGMNAQIVSRMCAMQAPKP